eukprot:Nitzschia sp. Nitz4//scaffold72_size95085//15730//17157//NITZ4_004746-RA/size95085-processed-gene-0.80-mRNA-1//1//CDS//3329557333//1878//frame0
MVEESFKARRTDTTRSPSQTPPLVESESPISSPVCDFKASSGSPVGGDPASNVDSMLAAEMSALSTEDREQIYFDIHGVSDKVQETEDLLRNSLGQMDEMLSKPLPNNQAFLLALAQNPVYVNDIEFRLRFLRANRFDVPGAVQRYLKYYELKQELFGNAYLTKDITQADLDEDDLGALHNTIGYALPGRDPAGRFVIVLHIPSVDYPPRAFARKGFYAFMIASESVETQHRGSVSVNYYRSHKFSMEDYAKRREISGWWGKILAAAPVRVEALHTVTDSFLYRAVVAIFKVAAEAFTRLRVREHFGDEETTLFSLQTFGIPIQEYHHDFFQGDCTSNAAYWRSRAEYERQHLLDDKKGPIRTPTQFDVLLGRGRSVYAHAGNVHLRNLVMEHAAQYDGAVFLDKKRVANLVLALIKARTGRFLRSDGDTWEEVDDETALKKVAHAFRTFRAVTTPARLEMGGGEKRTRENNVVQ